MSETYLEPIPSSEQAGSTPSHEARPWRWPKRFFVALGLLWVVAQGVSVAIEHTRLRRVLTSQFETAMGRPVKVGSYHFSFWDGPVIEARSVTVGEDPRFGAEYFLRADSIVLHLGWRSLLGGGAEFGAISLNHPSLNLVRNSRGDWNLAEWLPRSTAQLVVRGFTGPIAPSPASRFRRIEIAGGRINFKLVDEKLPFAFADVTGVVEAKGQGRWSLNLQAVPWRAAVALQQAGRMEVSGEIAGTSSRLRPATIGLTWTDASLPDVLRLARNNDFGVRGLLTLSVDARTDADAGGWTLRSRLQLQGLHRWDLSIRPDNPSLNMTAQVAYRPSSPSVELVQAAIETPHSKINASGRIYWNAEKSSHNRPLHPEQGLLTSADLDARDVLAWAHAFHSGITDDFSARGLAHAEASFAGWPPRLTRAELSSDGVDLSGPALLKPVQVGPLQVHFTSDTTNRDAHGFASLGPLSISWGASGHPEGLLRLENVAKRAPGAAPVWRVSGSTSQVRDLVAGANAFGWNVARGWDVRGPFTCDLRWREVGGVRLADALRLASGWMEFGGPASASDGVVLRVPYLNLPIEQIRARVDFTDGIRLAKLSSAQAFGARWSGTLERHDASMPWQFDLAADQLSAADLDRWLNPRWRESFFDRMLPFLNSRSPTAPPENLRAIGHLTVGRFALAQLVLSHLQGDLVLRSRRITLANADGQFYGGEVTGSLDADLQAVPRYHADLDLSHVNLPALLALTPSIARFTAESAGGQISFDARGTSQPTLISSLTCQGRVGVRGLEFLDFWNSGGHNERFSEGSADFSCGQGTIDFQHFELMRGEDSVADGAGTVDFRGALDFRLRTDSDMPGVSSPRGKEFHLTGTLNAPHLSPMVASFSRRSR